METSDFLLANMRLCHQNRHGASSPSSAATTVSVPGGLLGWDRATKRLWPTLARQSTEEAWGFSLSLGWDVGENTAHWSGVATRRNDKGIWAKVGGSIMQEKQGSSDSCYQFSVVYRTRLSFMNACQ